MHEPRHAYPDPELPPAPREWLLTNGIGGYASGTVSGRLARRYHGLLIAAQPPPMGRVLTLVELDALLETGGREPVRLGGHPTLAGAGRPVPATTFALEHGLPVWTWDLGDRRIRRRITLVHGRNTTSIEYALLDGDPVDLVLRPLFQLRGHDDPVDTPGAPARTEAVDGGLDISGEGVPTVRLRVPTGVLYTDEEHRFPGIHYELEAERGYPSEGELWSPGTLGLRLEAGRPLTLVASTELSARPEPDHDRVRSEEIDRREQLIERAGVRGEPLASKLVLAADAFVFRPVGRDPSVSVIAGYHWFTDWGRDTMISLDGLTLATGRHEEAAAILRSFARHVRDGLIPNLFPEGDESGLYHTADATLWFFHAVQRYLRRTGDESLLESLLPTLHSIVEHHSEGTRFGIAVDPDDGLLRQGEEGYQLTWMDAKVDDWVVTPRRGKAVEINALWYNALRLLADWSRERDPDTAAALDRRADRVRSSFNAAFWNADGEYLHDRIDERGQPDDDFRPNQVFAISLDHPVLDRGRWAPVVDAVADRLLTPVGLRSLEPGHPDYQPVYTGALRARDAAYHQGTVWGWLIGPFIDAWLRAYPDRRAEARRHLDGLIRHLDDAGVGTMSEIFDAEPPFTPRGCIAQAWTVAEVLRCLRRIERSEGA